MHPRVAVGLATPAMDLADLLGEDDIFADPLRVRTLAPGVVTALGDAEGRLEYRSFDEQMESSSLLTAFAEMVGTH
jgi:hypothetical protein